MIAKVDSACLVGVEAAPVQVEVSLTKGMPSLSIVGLPDASVREAKDRVIAAIRHTGFEIPSKRVTVNLAPAGLRKEGASFDLPIAIGILLASKSIAPKRWPRAAWLGELALDGTIRSVRGALALARSLSKQGNAGLVVPSENYEEVVCLPNIRTFHFRHLGEVVDWLQGDGTKPKFQISNLWAPTTAPLAVDFADIKGQALAKRALEIAAAGQHNLLMMGPPGTGKSMIAQAIPGILPTWTLEEALDATQIHSVAGSLKEKGVMRARPFRNPHHSASTAGLLGGGDVPLPGEISLAHRGVLFLDELPEFRRDALEALRQPLEQGVIHIQRARGGATYPAQFLLLAAMNPCPCGYRGHPQKECDCSVLKIRKYIGKISGPLLDRIDLHVELPALKVDELFEEKISAETSAQVKARVEHARVTQHERYHSLKSAARTNAQLSARETRRFCPISSDGETLLRAAVERLGFSARAFDRIRRVSRTIADLDSTPDIQPKHVAEAIHYRLFDRRNNF